MKGGWIIFQKLIVVGTTIWDHRVEVLHKKFDLWAQIRKFTISQYLFGFFFVLQYFNFHVYLAKQLLQSRFLFILDFKRTT